MGSLRRQTGCAFLGTGHSGNFSDVCVRGDAWVDFGHFCEHLRHFLSASLHECSYVLLKGPEGSGQMKTKEESHGEVQEEMGRSQRQERHKETPKEGEKVRGRVEKKPPRMGHPQQDRAAPPPASVSSPILHRSCAA